MTKKTHNHAKDAPVGDERRRHARHGAKLPALLESDGNFLPAEVVNISEGGVEVRFGGDLPYFPIKQITLPSFGEALPCTAIWKRDLSIGLKFTGVPVKFAESLRSGSQVKKIAIVA